MDCNPGKCFTFLCFYFQHDLFSKQILPTNGKLGWATVKAGTQERGTERGTQV